MKVKDFYSINTKSNNAPKPSLYSVYRDDRKIQGRIDNLQTAFNSKKANLERVIESLSNGYLEIAEIDNKLDLSYEQLGIVWETYEQVLQENRLLEMDIKEISENLDELNSTVQQKSDKINELDNNKELIEYKKLIKDKEELEQKNIDREEFLKSLEKNIAAKQEEVENFNRTYQNKINLLNALEIQIQEKRTEIEKNTIEDNE